MAFNINRFTEKSQEAVIGAQQIAEELNHSQVEPEHLFAALLQQEGGVVPQVLQRLGWWSAWSVHSDTLSIRTVKTPPPAGESF